MSCRSLAGVRCYDARVRTLLTVPTTAILVASGIGLYAYLTRQDAPPRPLPAETERRVKEWAYVAQEKALSASEDLRLVVIPSEFGKFFDVRCLIYRNRETNTATFVCPEARQDQLEEAPK